jgi:hypothetical protein
MLLSQLTKPPAITEEELLSIHTTKISQLIKNQLFLLRTTLFVPSLSYLEQSPPSFLFPTLIS